LQRELGKHGEIRGNKLKKGSKITREYGNRRIRGNKERGEPE
jgi:hypothetical protein